MYKNECIVCGKQFSNKAESRLRQAMTIHMKTHLGTNNTLVPIVNSKPKTKTKYQRGKKNILSGNIHSIDTSKANNRQDLYKDLLRRCLMELGL